MTKFFLLLATASLAYSCKPLNNTESAPKVSSINENTTVALESPARKMILPLYAQDVGTYCTATAVGKNTIITAAQCFYGSNKDKPELFIRPAPKHNKNEFSYVIWNGGKDFPANSQIDDFQFSSKIKKVYLAPNTKPGALGLIAPNPDLAVACIDKLFPDSLLTSNIQSFDGNYSLDTLSQQNFRYYGFGANTNSGLGRGVLRQGTGIGVKIKQQDANQPIDIVDNSSWFDRLNPFHKPDAACKGDAGGPVYIATSGTFAGVISTGACDKNKSDKTGGLSFSPIDRTNGAPDWIADAIKSCDGS
jgi:hypothetical protein